MHVTKCGTITDGGSVYMEGDLSNSDNLPSNCMFDEYGLTCVLSYSNETDSENATQIQIENILNLIGFNLTTLYIGHTIIRDIPVAVCRLKQLAVLILEYNRLSTLRPIDCFAGMNQLGELNLRGNQIPELPDGIFTALPNLKKLHLDTNHISVLRKGIFDSLQQLIYLVARDNNIFTLQESIFANCTQLIYLDLSRNQIVDLPDRAFSYLQQLVFLNLSYNRISVLRDGYFDNIPQLINLYLNNNEISDPTRISTSLPQLRFLDLKYNHIAHLGSGLFRNLPQLAKLDLSFNRISIFSEEVFENLTHLTDLVLSNNNISQISDVPANLSRMQHLDLSYNQISDLQAGIFSGMEQLQYLDLTNNRISVLRSGTFNNLSKLNRMLLKNNNISIPTGICDNFPELQYLDISRNNISLLPVDCFTLCKNLIYLDISYNRLTFLPLDIIEALETIKYINISHNVIRILNFRIGVVNTIDPADPGNNLNVYIRWMDFSYNQITRVDAWLLVLAQFCNGCTVDLSYNRISYFAEFFGEKFYDNVKPYNIILDLKENNIRHITDMTKGLNFKQPAKFCCDDKNKFQQPFAITIYIDSLVCDCGDFTAKLYNVQYYFNLDLTQVICSAPTNLRNTSFTAISIDYMVCNVEEECPPNCECIEQPSTNSTIINCTDAGLTDLPTTLPTLNRLPGFKYHLILSKNHINRLNYKEYINETTRLDISNSGVEEIDLRMWRAFQTMSNVPLRNNLLTQFPEVQHGSFTGNQLDIQNNPISCDCKNKWLKSWLESIDKKILNSKGINCNTPEWLKGKSVILLQEEDFCSDPPYTLKDVLLITIPTMGGLVLLSVIVILLLRTFRFKIFKYTKIHLFDRDEC